MKPIKQLIKIIDESEVKDLTKLECQVRVCTEHDLKIQPQTGLECSYNFAYTKPGFKTVHGLCYLKVYLHIDYFNRTEDIK